MCGTADFPAPIFFYVDGTQGTSDTPVIWYVAYAGLRPYLHGEIHDHIDANRITRNVSIEYRGFRLTVGEGSYNGSISVKDANNSVKVTLDRNGITAVSGKIGGWILGTSALTASAPASGTASLWGLGIYLPTSSFHRSKLLGAEHGRFRHVRVRENLLCQ